MFRNYFIMPTCSSNLPLNPMVCTWLFHFGTISLHFSWNKNTKKCDPHLYEERRQKNTDCAKHSRLFHERKKKYIYLNYAMTALNSLLLFASAFCVQIALQNQCMPGSCATETCCYYNR